MTSSQIVRKLFQIHRWAGLILGALLLVTCVTGAVAVYKDEIDVWLNPYRAVAPVGKPLPLEVLYSTVAPQRPASLTFIPGRADRTVQFNLPGPAAAFVDPYTGKLTGQRSGETFSNTLRQLHLRFYYFGWQGRVFVGVLGLALTASILTGLWIYFPFLRGVRRQGLPWYGIPPGRLHFWSDWHKLIGVTSLLFNLVIALSGAVLGIENLMRFTPELLKTVHPGASVSTAKTPNDRRLTLDEALAATRRRLPSLDPTNITLPTAKAWRYVIHGNIPGTFVRDGAAFASIDAGTGAVIEMHDPRQAHSAIHFYNWMEPLHFGPFAKLLYLLLGLTPVFLSFSGYYGSPQESVKPLDWRGFGFLARLRNRGQVLALKVGWLGWEVVTNMVTEGAHRPGEMDVDQLSAGVSPYMAAD